MQTLDGAVPYSILAGNHDVVASPEGRFTSYLLYFGSERFQKQSDQLWYGEGEAGAQILNAGDQSYRMLSLSFDPDEEMIAWTNQVLSDYAGLPAILTTHNYLNKDGTRSETGQRLYDEVVAPNANVRLVLCGHNHNAEKHIPRGWISMTALIRRITRKRTSL